MNLIFLILILAGAICAAVAAIISLQAGLGLWRTRKETQQRLAEELSELTERAGELEEKSAALGKRASELPITISSLQQNLATLQFLTRTLSTSLRQAQRILSYDRLRTSGSAYVADTARKHLDEAARKLRNRRP